MYWLRGSECPHLDGAPQGPAERYEKLLPRSPVLGKGPATTAATTPPFWPVG